MKIQEKQQLQQFELYIKYCSKNSNSLQEFQMLLANARINRYFEKEFLKKEAEITHILKNVPSKKDKIQNFLMQEILDLHSPILISQETKPKDFTYLNHQFININ